MAKAIYAYTLSMKRIKKASQLASRAFLMVLLVANGAGAQTASSDVIVNPLEPDMSTATATAHESFQSGNLTRAVQQWTQAIRANEDVVRSLFNRSQAFVMLNQYDFALRDINQVIDLEGPNTGADVFLIQGIILSNLDRLPEALDSFQQAESRQPSDLIYSNRALVYQRAEDYPAALVDMERAIELAPTPVNQLNLANLHVQMGEHERAIARLNQLLESDDTFFPAYLARGIAFHNLGEHQSALQDFLYTLTIAPNQPEARYYSGLSLATLGHQEEAAQSLIAAADLYLAQNQSDSYHQVLEKMAELGL